MKFQLFIRKFTLISGILNLLTFVFAVILIVSVLVYQYSVLVPNNFQNLAPNSVNQVSFNFPHAYIQANGLAAYFGEKLGSQTWWNQLIFPFYVLSLLFASFNALAGIFLFYIAIRSKNNIILQASVFNIFLSLIGFFTSIWAFNKTKQMFVNQKKLNPKLRLKAMEDAISQKIANK